MGPGLKRRILQGGSTMVITFKRALEVGEDLGVNWKEVYPSEFRMGLEAELEHRDLTGGDLNQTALIALAHLKENSRYYTLLKESGL
jgi:hypothetical protein